MRAHEIQHLAAAGDLGLHAQAQIRPVEAVHEHGRIAAKQLAQDVGPGRGIGGRREGDRLDAAERRLGSAERQILGPEIVPPLRDAMGLVDREQPDPGALEQVEGVGLGEPLGRDIDEPQLAVAELLVDLPVLVEIVGRVEARRRDAVAPELRHLIAHQRDQRRHHHGDGVAQQRGQLVAQRLAAAGRHDGEHVGTRQNGLDDGTLAGPEILEPEGRAQRRLGGGEIRHGRVQRIGVDLYLFQAWGKVYGLPKPSPGVRSSFRAKIQLPTERFTGKGPVRALNPSHSALQGHFEQFKK
jgi:hypothetical protein